MCKRAFHIVALYLFSLSAFSCVATNLDFSRDARDTFVKIKQSVVITACNPENPSECLSKESRSSGSGAVVMRTNAGSYVLTAGHVCSFEREMEIASSVGAARIDVEMKSVNFKLGERVYNVAAPVGIFYQDVVPLLEGFFMGDRDLRAYYSIPAMGGSSGSPIFNKDSEIIGMIHSVNIYFPVVSVSPPKDLLREFIIRSVRMGEEKRLNKNNQESKNVNKTLWETLGLSKPSKMSDISLNL